MVFSAVQEADNPASGINDEATQPGGADGDGGDLASSSVAMAGHLVAMVARQLQTYDVDGHTAVDGAAPMTDTAMAALKTDFNIVW